MADKINWRTRGGGRSGIPEDAPGPGEGVELQESKGWTLQGAGAQGWDLGSPGAEDGDQGWGRCWGRSQKDAGAAGRGWGDLSGGTASGAPRRAQAVGEAVPEPQGLAGRGGWWDQALSLLSVRRGRAGRLVAASRQGWAAAGQVRQVLSQLCRAWAHQASAWHWSHSEVPAIYKSHP